MNDQVSCQNHVTVSHYEQSATHTRRIDYAVEVPGTYRRLLKSETGFYNVSQKTDAPVCKCRAPGFTPQRSRPRPGSPSGSGPHVRSFGLVMVVGVGRAEVVLRGDP